MRSGLPTPDSDPFLPPEVLEQLWPEDRVLTDLPVAVTIGAAGVAGIVWAVRRARRVRRERRASGTDVPGSWHRTSATAALAASGVVLLALGASLVANWRSGYVPTWEALGVKLVALGVLEAPPSGLAERGTVRTVDIPGRPGAQIADQAAWVYLPPHYDPEGPDRYPVVYLLHGSPDEPSSWFAGGYVPHTMDVLLDAGLIDPMIVVSPTANGTGARGFDTECLDSTKGGSQVETYLTCTVRETIDDRFNTLTDRAHRVVGGMSAGGFCALNLGLRHLDLYSTILAIEPYGDPGEKTERAMLSTQAEIDANTPFTYLPTMEFPEPVAVFLDSGEKSPKEAVTTAQMAGFLEEQGQTVWLREEPGQGHDWRMAAIALPYGLVFAQQQMDSSDDAPEGHG
jgi:enterochelin esterase-like enzyme